jgi:hypothetical protein
MSSEAGNPLAEHGKTDTSLDGIARQPRVRLQLPESSGNVISRSTAADPVRFVQEEFSIAERGFGVLINSHDDRLDVL